MRYWVTARLEGDEFRATVHAAAPYGEMTPREAHVMVDVPEDDALASALGSVLQRYQDQARRLALKGAAEMLVEAHKQGEE